MDMVDDVVSSVNNWVTLSIGTSVKMVVFNNSPDAEVRYRLPNSTSIGIILEVGKEVSLDSDIEIQVSPKYGDMADEAIITRILINQ